MPGQSFSPDRHDYPFERHGGGGDVIGKLTFSPDRRDYPFEHWHVGVTNFFPNLSVPIAMITLLSAILNADSLPAETFSPDRQDYPFDRGSGGNCR